MNKKFGFTAVEVLVVIGMIIVMGAACAGLNKYAFGNKQYFDFRQNFKYAYVTEGTNIVKYSIKAWKDWENSDAIQVITTDDKVIYTHLNRVLLTDK